MNVFCAFFALAVLPVSLVSADVTVDEFGVGFVGKGDVQSVYDWNNSMLQANAHLIQFKFSSAGTVSWYCEGVNAAGKTVTTDVRIDEIGVSNYIAYDARKNRTGQITGFVLTGFDGDAITTNTVGDCGRSTGFQVPFRLISEINYQGSDDPSLKVSIDGQTWFDLQLIY